MNRLPTLFIGFFATFLTAWLGLVIIPYFQFGQLEPQVDPDTGDQFPPAPTGLALRGAQVYRASGCIYCHSQQIRPADLQDGHNRGWGARRTVPRDYLYEKPPQLGTMRTGPDLTNVGVRLNDAAWHHEHLYAPQSKAAWSIMAPYKYLYTVRKIEGQPSPKALKLQPPYAPAEGYEVVPTPDAEALVAYLLSLNRNYALPEAPVE
ncbi:MAG: cbb3-type cytochrome c oxidase subunit II [Candidatus Methylacidiphilales bacterium]|nr:cbb3-type cytochrome c oxidase subunit II [Candidatus Methylacidiphilales bacterium]